MVVFQQDINENSLISSLDWLPTIASIAQIPLDDILTDKNNNYIVEGEDVSDIWLHSSSSSNSIFGDENEYIYIDRSRNKPLFWRPLRKHDIASIRFGSWKLYFGKEEMYYLVDDEYETNNLYHDLTYVGIRDILIQELIEWNSTLPTVNCRKNDDGRYKDRCPQS